MNLAHFRSRYPQGSLIGELLTIHNGKYLVRVLIQLNGITLATGLAAADTPEQAEDTARERALAVLNFNEPSAIVVENGQTPVSRSEMPIPLPEHTPIASNVPPISPAKVTANAPSVSNPPQTPQLTPQETPNAPVPQPPQASHSTAVEPPSVDEPLLLELMAESDEDIPSDFDEPMVEPLAEEVSPEPYLPEPPSTESLDFSEVIARSNVEMKRLKWTQEQGRNYLLQTYGKRSRQLLSDEELLEFLHYLKELPTP